MRGGPRYRHVAHNGKEGEGSKLTAFMSTERKPERGERAIEVGSRGRMPRWKRYFLCFVALSALK